MTSFSRSRIRLNSHSYHCCRGRQLVSGSTGYLSRPTFADVASYHIAAASHPASPLEDVRWLPQPSTQSYDGYPYSYRVSCNPEAAPQAPPPKTSGLVRRAASSSPPRQPARAHAEPISGAPHARRAKTPSHRPPGSAMQLDSTGQQARRLKVASAAVRSVAADEGRGRDGNTGGAKQPPLLLGCTDTPDALGFPHLRQHRTWRLLRRLVDELEHAQSGGANSAQPENSLLHEPGALQELLQPLMRLLPLREMLHQLLERAESPSPADCCTSQGEGRPAAPPPSSKLRRTRFSSPQLTPQRSAAVRSKSARGPASSAASAWLERGGKSPHSNTSSFARASPSRQRPALAVSPSRWRGTTGRGGPPSLEAQLDSLIAKSKRNSAAASLKPTPGHRQAGRSAAVEGGQGGCPPSRGGGAPPPRQADVGKPAKAVAVAAHARRSPERPWSGRSVSPARHEYPQPKLQVASRLPPGALQHRRSPKTRLRPTSGGDRRQQQQEVRFSEAWEKLMQCAPVAPDPPDSSRSADSEDTLKSGSLIEGGGPPACSGGPYSSLAAAGGWMASSPWKQNPGFTSVHVLGTQPPSLSSASSIEVPSGMEDAPPRESPLQRRDTSEIMRQTGHGGAELEEPSGVHTGRPRPSLRIPASRVSPLRRHTAAAAPLSASASTEGERQLGRPERNTREGRVESVMVGRRDKRLTLAEAMKKRGEALGGKPSGRLTPREIEVEEESQQQQLDAGSPRVSALKETSRLREGRRATTQVVTSSSPRSAASVSPRPSLSPKPKGEKTQQQVSQAKATMTRKDSTASLLKGSSSRGLVPPSVGGGRRVSAPPAPRRPSTQPRPPPSSPPPRVRHSVAAGAGEARVGSLSLKNHSAKKKGGKGGVAAGKAKAKNGAASKAELTPSDTSNAPEEEEEEINSVEEETTPAEPPQEPPEPPYPFLRLAELPLLDAPLRPIPSLSGILPTRTDSPPPPKVDDNVTFMHVLDRSERLTETARDMATRHAVANLSSDAPGTMLLIARWMDTSVEAVETDSAAAKEKLPWREVVPPLFVGIDTHRDLLSPRLPRNPRVLEELRAFLEAEGFVETQEQKLRQLLAAKSDSNKPTNESPEKPKAPTALDIYLDYVLAVAVAYLRLRQQPVVLPKPSRFVIGGGGDESGGSTCCQSDDASCTRDSSLASSDVSACNRGGFGCTDTREDPLSTAASSSLAEDDLPTPRAQRRCWSCLPVRGSLKNCLLSPVASGCSTSSVLARCLSPAARGPPELDLYESTAAQQVRRLVDRMPLLPSEKYLRYLRCAGKKRELETLAVWLAGRPDVLPDYSAFIELMQKQGEGAAPLLKTTSPQEAGANPAATTTDPVSVGREIASKMTSGLQQGAGTKTNSLEQPTAAQQAPAPGEDSAQSSSAGNEAESLESGQSISLPPSPRSPQLSFAPPLSFNDSEAVDQQVIEASRHKGNLLPASPTAAASGKSHQRSRGAPKELAIKSHSANTQTASEGAHTSSMQQLPSWGSPAEPLPIKQKPTGSKATTSVSHPRASSIAASVAKVKGGKKASPAKSTSLRAMQSIDKGSPAAVKPALSQGGGSKYASKLQLLQGSVRDRQGAPRGPQPASPLSPGSQSDEFEAARFPSVSAAKLAALASLEVDPKAPFFAEPHKLRKTLSEEAITSPPQRRAVSTSRQPLSMSPQSSSGRLSTSLKGGVHYRDPSSPKKGSHVPTLFPRRAAATATPKRAGGGGPPGSRQLPRTQGARQPDQWTRRAVKLLSEPQMLAEVASLCSRLSALSCCVQTPERGAPEQRLPDESEPIDFIEVAR
ncbi:hypothetical protein Emed_000384 [Eimeria media]